MSEMHENDFVRVLIMGDTHCGSVSGLTPPAREMTPEQGTEQYELYELRRWLYSSWANALEPFRPFDVAIFNGDLIDGDQSRSSGWELLEVDRLQQAEMAKHLVRQVGASVNKFVMGTAYHTGPDEDYEALVANEFDERIQKEVVLTVRGTTFHATHHVSGSSLAHTRQNALGREINDMLVRLAKRRIDADWVHILVRSHCHYGGSISDHGMTAYRVPALQLANGHKWARRFASGTLDYGILVVDVYGEGRFQAYPIPFVLPPREATLLDDGLIEAASEEMRQSGIEALLRNPPEPAVVPQGYVGGR